MNYEEKLSNNFRLREFVYSKKALENEIINIPNEVQIANLRNLSQKVMQKIRDYYNLPITITSGFRSHELNKAVKGNPESQHLKGQACDFTIKDFNMNIVYNFIVHLLEIGKIDFDQCILYKKKNFIHISYNDLKNRNQHFIKD